MSEKVTNTMHDAIIIGAGVCGIYMLHKLMEMGMDATVVDAAERPGGTWNKNRYPGARFDSESYTYAYSFNEEIMQEWDWSEHFAGQPETLRYLTYVVDKLGLRDHMQFNRAVTAARYDENNNCWHVDFADGRSLSARYLCTALGLLSAPTKPRYEGVPSFEGESFHTYDWPEGLDYSNKRVAVIGTGATGVQIISEIADKVSDLKVFQRRPNWCAPLKNSKIEDQAALKASYGEMLEKMKLTLSGFVHTPKMIASAPARALPPDRRPYARSWGRAGPARHRVRSRPRIRFVHPENTRGRASRALRDLRDRTPPCEVACQSLSRAGASDRRRVSGRHCGHERGPPPRARGAGVFARRFELCILR